MLFFGYACQNGKESAHYPLKEAECALIPYRNFAVKAVYDFENAAAADKDYQIIVHHNKNMNSVLYEQLKEVVFDTDQSGIKAVRRLWFVTLCGIVAFEDCAGNLHQREVV